MKSLACQPVSWPLILVLLLSACGRGPKTPVAEVAKPAPSAEVPQASPDMAGNRGAIQPTGRTPLAGMGRPGATGRRVGASPVRLPDRARPPVDCPITLADVTARTGITFRHTDGGSGQGYIVQGMTAGLATFDCDGDGLVDIYFVNGAPLKGTTVEVPPQNALYHNNGDFTFTNVTQKAGVGDLGYGMGVAVGDYDNDGYPDLYVSNFGRKVLYHNNGDGTFTDVTAKAGVGDGQKVGAAPCFLDIDGDGYLDLYVANYVNFTYENHVPIVINGRNFQAGPQYYSPIPHTLLRNNGDGTFTDISVASGIASVPGPGMGAVAFDYDDDGDTDIFVCNDGAADFLFQNDGRGHFREVALAANVAFDFQGKANSSMAADCGDYDNDGRLDLFVTDYQAEMPVLFHNLGDGLFDDATSTAAITSGLFPHVKWGVGFVDFDNDGLRDLYIAAGHFDPIELIDDRTAFAVRNFLLRNIGGKFVDVSDGCGDGLRVVASSRGAAFDDLDNDGRIDVAVLNSCGPPTILRNQSATGNHWLQIQLQGVKANRDGVGARVKVVAGDLSQVAEVHAGRGYESHFGTRLHFGLGKRARIDRVEVRWPGGGTDRFAGPAADRLVVLTEGTGRLEN